MKPLSRTDWLLCAVLAVLLLACGAFLAERHQRRQYAAQNGRFSKPYTVSISRLISAMDAINGRFQKNRSIPVYTGGLPVEAAVTQPASPVLLQGISWQADIPVAMINGKVYQTGDRIGDCTLEEIKINTIRLRDDAGKTVEIRLMQEVSP